MEEHKSGNVPRMLRDYVDNAGLLFSLEGDIFNLYKRLDMILSCPHLSYDIEYAGILFMSVIPSTKKEKIIQDSKRARLICKLISDYLHTEAKIISSRKQMAHQNHAKMINFPAMEDHESENVSKPLGFCHIVDDIPNPTRKIIQSILESYLSPLESQSPITPEEYEVARKETLEKGKQRALNEDTYQVKIQNQMDYKDEDFVEYGDNSINNAHCL